MTLNLDVVGHSGKSHTVKWTSDEALLYAIAVGAGQEDPLAELPFTTDNSHDIDQRVLPTFGVVLTQFRGGSGLDVGDFNPAMLVHAEQSVELTQPLPSVGELEVSSTVTGIYDKGSGALVVSEATGRAPGTQKPLVVTRSSVFIRGEGGFGVAGPKDPWTIPERAPDLTLKCSTRADQALLYRLTGDHNPLHSDPDFAAQAGFPRPILHGMCTYGVVGRTLLNELADGDPGRFIGMGGRFSKPVFPGETMYVRVWRDEFTAKFQVVNELSEIVLDRGTLALSR